MNHNLIIKSIINNDGFIVGSYVREWAANGRPMDIGWNDIDVSCPEEKINIIKNKIYNIDKNINLDFSAGYSPYYRSKYSADLIAYDGKFKILPPHQDKEKEYIELTKNKICKFLNANHIGRRLSLEKRLILSGWKLIILDKIYDLNNYQFI